MNASTTPTSSPVSPFRAHVHARASVYARTRRPGGGGVGGGRQPPTHTGALWPTRPELTPLPSFPSMVIRQIYSLARATTTNIYEHPRGGPDARLSVTRVCSRIKLLRTIYRCHRYHRGWRGRGGAGCRVYLLAFSFQGDRLFDVREGRRLDWGIERAGMEEVCWYDWAKMRACVFIFFLEGELRGRELLVYMGTLWLNRGLFLVDGGSSWCDQKILGNHDFELDVSCMKDISGDSWIVLARKFLIIYPDNLKGK